MKEKLIMTSEQAKELFSDETLTSMELTSIHGGLTDPDINFGDCSKSNCTCTNTAQKCNGCEPTPQPIVYTDCNCLTVKAFSLDCGNTTGSSGGGGGMAKWGLCDITSPMPKINKAQ